MVGLLLLVLTGGLSAQKVTVSDAISLRKDDFYQILGRIGDRILLHSDNGYSLELLSFDDRLRLLSKKELELDKRRTHILGLVPAQQQFALVYQYTRKGELFVKAHRYDGSGVLQDSASVITFPPGVSSPDCRMVVSDDGGVALLYFTEKQTWLHAYALDLRTLELLWSSRLAIDSYSFYKQFRSLLVDNAGRMHLVLEKEARKATGDLASLELVQFGPGYTVPLSRHISLEGLQPARFKFVYDNRHQRLTGLGLFTERQPSRSHGLFCFFLDDQSEGGFEIYQHPFREEVSRKLTGNPEAFRKGLEDLDIRDVLLREDGGVVVFAEESRRVERNIAGQQFQFSPAGGRFIVDHYFEDLLVTSFGPGGQLDWQEVLPKKQYSQDDDGLYSSVFLMTAPDQVRLLFNDEIAYENTVSAYTLNHRGQLDRISVLSTDYQKLKLIFRESVQTGVYELLVPSERSGKVRLVKIEF